jgi:hypothetical protein
MTPPTPGTSPFIPDPWDWVTFRATIEQARGRPLVLVPVDLSSGLSPLWMVANDADLIVYSRTGERIEQLREIAHQAAHMLLGHRPATNDADLLFPHLDPAIVAAVLTIPRFHQADECVATEFAS